eukprot:1170713-Prorocentrum_minimum.AAC.1
MFAASYLRSAGSRYPLPSSDWSALQVYPLSPHPIGLELSRRCGCAPRSAANTSHTRRRFAFGHIGSWLRLCPGSWRPGPA